MILWWLACKATPVPTPAPGTPVISPGTPTVPSPIPRPHPTGSTASTADTAVENTADTAPFSIGCDSEDVHARGMLDCDGHCFPAAYVGDGLICDDGTERPWGAPNFDCADFGFDGGDCSATADTG